MGLGDLFTANDNHTLDLFGKGVSAQSVYLVDPESGAQTEITRFVFESDAANQIAIIEQGDENSFSGSIEIATTYQITEKHTFVIDGRTWNFNGFGGIDSGVQTILIKAPKLASIRSSRASRR